MDKGGEQKQSRSNNGKGPIEQIRSANSLISACLAGTADKRTAIIGLFGLLSLKNECVNQKKRKKKIYIMANESRLLSAHSDKVRVGKY